VSGNSVSVPRSSACTNGTGVSPSALEPLVTKRGVSHYLDVSEREVDRLVAPISGARTRSRTTADSGRRPENFRCEAGCGDQTVGSVRAHRLVARPRHRARRPRLAHGHALGPRNAVVHVDHRAVNRYGRLARPAGRNGPWSTPVAAVQDIALSKPRGPRQACSRQVWQPLCVLP
jgi:hypothetical protein